MIIVPQSATFRWMTPNILQEIESAGRVAYKSEPKITETSAEPFVRGLIKRKHEAVLEHASMSYHLVCDRGVSHELVRHRIASFTQESTRYCDYDGGLSVVEPPGLVHTKDDWGSYDAWSEVVRVAEEEYRGLREAGAPPEIARSVLPTCTKTEVRVTANIREWRHIFNLRWKGTTGRPHPQMRELMEMVALDAVSRCPALFDDIVPAGGAV
jgi:thymidylate synthase (FAD)